MESCFFRHVKTMSQMGNHPNMGWTTKHQIDGIFKSYFKGGQNMFQPTNQQAIHGALWPSATQASTITSEGIGRSVQQPGFERL